MFEGIPIDKLTAPVLLGICVLLILTGRLIPRRVYQDKSEECDRYREAFETEREARATSDAQTSELLEGQKTLLHLVEAIFQNSETARKGGEDLVAS
jgi:hypothetical protein